jgi:ribosomal protein S18 acetylase RimI-like enzyme
MTLPLPEGWRPIRVEDATTVAALIDEDEVYAGFRSRLGSEDVIDMSSRTDLEHDSWLRQQDGRVVAAGGGQLHAGTYFARGSVRPGSKGRGLGSLLLDFSEVRAGEHRVATVHQVALGPDAAARRLLESRGYREVRRHFEMTIELDEEPAEPELPEGLAIEVFREGDARVWHAAVTEALEDLWGFEAGPFEDWWRLRAGDDHSLWFLVRDREEIAAFARCEEGRRGGALVGELGVRKPWREQGLGRALLQHAFRELRRRGVERVGLVVDSANPSGATRLYESVGMLVEADHVTFAKPVL